MTKKGNTMAGLTSLPRKKNIKGQPHKLAYITEAESDLLKSMGGAGKPRKGTKGVPSYDFPDYEGEFDDPSEADTIGGVDDTLGITDPKGNIDDPTGVGGGRGGDPRDFGFDPREAELSALQAQAQRDFAVTGPLVGDETFGGFFDPFSPEFPGYGFPDVPTTSKGAVDSITKAGLKRGQQILDARFFSPDLLGIPQMNKLEDEGFKTFGQGYRGPFEARTPFGVLRKNYDPNFATGAGSAPLNLTFFKQFAKENPSLTTVEAMAQYNATANNREEQVSISDVQSMGFDLNAPVGPQAAFAEAESYRGLALGAGLLAQTAVTGSPMGALTDIALSGTGKGVVGHVADMFEEATGIDLPEAPDLGIPSFAEIASGVFGPEQDTMAPGSFGIGLSSSAEMSTPTDTDVGVTGFGTIGDYDLGFGGSEPIAPLPVQKPVIKEKEEVIETPSPTFPVRDTTPPSRVSRIANIYGINEDAAKRMLGIA